MSHIDPGPLPGYNSLTDPHLAGFFSNTRMRKHLNKQGLVTRRGQIVSESTYRLNMARKEHKRHVKNLLAQAIVHKTLDLERHRQVEIKRKLEEIAKIELVRRVRVEKNLLSSKYRSGLPVVTVLSSPSSTSSTEDTEGADNSDRNCRLLHILTNFRNDRVRQRDDALLPYIAQINGKKVSGQRRKSAGDKIESKESQDGARSFSPKRKTTTTGHKEEQLLPLLSPRSRMGKTNRPSSVPANKTRGRKKARPISAPPQDSDNARAGRSYSTDDGRPKSRHEGVTDSFSQAEVDTRNLTSLDPVALRKYAAALSRHEQGFNAVSPYLMPQIGYLVPSPPKSPRRSARSRPARRMQSSPRETMSARSASPSQRTPRDDSNKMSPKSADGAIDGHLILHRQEPALKGQENIQSFCTMTLKYHGKNLALPRDQLDPTQEVLVEQQHCGGNTLPVFKKRLIPGSTFRFISRRHRGYPFSLSLYIDGIMDCRVSSCCEYKHIPGSKLGGKQGHFSLAGVTGAAPCYRCQVEKELRLQRKTKKKSKKETVTTEEKQTTVEVTEQVDEEEDDYDEDFEDEDNGSKDDSSKSDDESSEDKDSSDDKQQSKDDVKIAVEEPEAVEPEAAEYDNDFDDSEEEETLQREKPEYKEDIEEDKTTLSETEKDEKNEEDSPVPVFGVPAEDTPNKESPKKRYEDDYILSDGRKIEGYSSEEEYLDKDQRGEAKVEIHESADKKKNEAPKGLPDDLASDSDKESSKSSRSSSSESVRKSRSSSSSSLSFRSSESNDVKGVPDDITKGTTSAEGTIEVPVQEKPKEDHEDQNKHVTFGETDFLSAETDSDTTASLIVNDVLQNASRKADDDDDIDNYVRLTNASSARSTEVSRDLDLDLDKDSNVKQRSSADQTTDNDSDTKANMIVNGVLQNVDKVSDDDFTYKNDPKSDDVPSPESDTRDQVVKVDKTTENDSDTKANVIVNIALHNVGKTSEDDFTLKSSPKLDEDERSSVRSFEGLKVEKQEVESQDDTMLKQKFADDQAPENGSDTKAETIVNDVLQNVDQVSDDDFTFTNSPKPDDERPKFERPKTAKDKTRLPVYQDSQEDVTKAEESAKVLYLNSADNDDSFSSEDGSKGDNSAPQPATNETIPLTTELGTITTTTTSTSQQRFVPETTTTTETKTSVTRPDSSHSSHSESPVEKHPHSDTESDKDLVPVSPRSDERSGTSSSSSGSDTDSESQSDFDTSRSLATPDETGAKVDDYGTGSTSESPALSPSPPSNLLDLTEDSTILNLCGIQLTQNKLKEVCKHIEQNESLEEVTIKNIELGELETQRLTFSLKNSPGKLTALTFDGNNLGAVGAGKVADILKLKPSIHTLRIYNNPIGDEGVKLLVDTLLRIHGEEKQSQFIKQLSVEESGRLREITEEEEQDKPDELKELMSVIGELENKVNLLGAEDGAEVSTKYQQSSSEDKFVEDFTDQLINLALERSQDSSDAVICREQSETTKQSSSSDTKMSENTNGMEENVDRPTENKSETYVENQQKFCHLESLELKEVEITDVGVGDLAVLLAQNTNLSHIDIEGNSKVTLLGWKQLAAGLQVNNSLLHLSLNHCFLGDDGLDALLLALQNNNSLRALGLVCTGIGEYSGRCLVDLLKRNTYLIQIELIPGNNISEGTMREIKNYLALNQNMLS